jgi:hypothetical protein
VIYFPIPFVEISDPSIDRIRDLGEFGVRGHVCP